MKHKLILCAALIAAATTAGDTNYTVVKKDCLWNLSGQYLSNPFYWPEIWNANPHIKNPNLIYPGDKIVIPAQLQAKADASKNGGTTAVVSQDEFTSALNYYYMNHSDLYSVSVLRAAPFVEPLESESSALATIKDDSRKIFCLGNTVTVELASEGTVNVGDQLDILHEGKPFKRDGSKYAVITPVGSATVTKISGSTARVQITDNWGTIFDGDKIVARRNFNKMESPTVDMNVTAVETDMLTTVDHSAMLKPFNYIILNAGKDKEITPGDLFIATGQGKKGDSESEPAFRGIVVRSDANSSTLLVEEVRKYSSAKKFLLKRAARLTFK